MKPNETRPADTLIEESAKKLTKRLSLIANKKIKFWKALLIIVFVAGFATSLAWTVSTGSGMPGFAATASCFTDPLWSEEYCTKDCQCDLGQGDCDKDEDCKSGYCTQDVGQKYGQKKSMDVCEGKPAWACQETDNGQDYNQKGITSYKGQSKTDYCKNKTNLKEYYCKAYNKIDDKTYKCPNGCQDGACVSPSCKNLNGNICKNNEICDGTYLNAADSFRCCKSACQAKVPNIGEERTLVILAKMDDGYDYLQPIEE